MRMESRVLFGKVSVDGEIPDRIVKEVRARLLEDLLTVVDAFNERCKGRL